MYGYTISGKSGLETLGSCEEDFSVFERNKGLEVGVWRTKTGLTRLGWHRWSISGAPESYFRLCLHDWRWSCVVVFEEARVGDVVNGRSRIRGSDSCRKRSTVAAQSNWGKFSHHSNHQQPFSATTNLQSRLLTVDSTTHAWSILTFIIILSATLSRPSPSNSYIVQLTNKQPTHLQKPCRAPRQNTSRPKWNFAWFEGECRNDKPTRVIVFYSWFLLFGSLVLGYTYSRCSAEI